MRAWLGDVLSHSSELHGCDKCDGSGLNIGTLRTDHSFRNQLDPSHHHRHSILENLNYLDMINCRPLDPMHLLDLGLLKRMLDYLFRTKYPIENVTVNSATARQFSAALISLRPFISRIDFARQPRGLKELCRWKATEFRQILHYTGVVHFKLLGGKLHRHFLSLHVGVKLLSCDPWFREHNNYANELISFFVRRSPFLYSASFVTYNTHMSYHLAKDCLYHDGPLCILEAYIFENHYGIMARYLRKNDNPLQQLVKRLYERRAMRHILRKAVKPPTQLIELFVPHNSGPLVTGLQGRQFKKAKKHQSWQLSTLQPDHCVYLNDLSVILICNFVQLPDRTVVVGYKYLTNICVI